MRYRGEVKSWPPDVDEARPHACVGCGVACRDGGILQIHGHGVVERQQRGPPSPGAPPVCIIVLCRRYLCRACGAVMRVLPAGATARKHFSGAAIGLALAAWGLCAMSARAVRQLVNDARMAGMSARGWRTLTRWADDVRTGRLFSMEELKGLPPGRRACAARVGQVLAGHAPPSAAGTPVSHQAFAGALHVA